MDELTGRPRTYRTVATGVLAIGAALFATAAALSVSLPHGYPASHWSMVWSGLDIATGTCATVTAVLLRRGSARAALPAAACAGLLVGDAWFDVGTASPGWDLLVASGEAALVELPLAVLAGWLALTLTTRHSGPA